MKIGKYLVENIPSEYEQQAIIDSAHVQPLSATTHGTMATHWAFLVKPPHPKNVIKHGQWIAAAETSEWYHPAISKGDKRNPPKLCRCCKGRNHSTLQCPLSELPFWQEITSLDKPNDAVRANSDLTELSGTQNPVNTDIRTPYRGRGAGRGTYRGRPARFRGTWGTNTTGSRGRYVM
jgi:hypothetical protein